MRSLAPSRATPERIVSDPEQIPKARESAFVARPLGLTLWHPPSADRTAPVDRSSGRLRWDSAHRRALLAADLLAAVLGTIVAVGIVGRQALGPTMLVLLPVMALLCRSFGLYDRDNWLLRAKTLDEAPSALMVSTVFAAVVWLADDALIAEPLSKGLFLVLLLGVMASMLSGRAVGRAIAGRVSRAERCLLVSADPFGFERLARLLGLGSGGKAEVALGVVLDRSAIPALADRGLRRLITHHQINRVVIAPDTVDPDSVLDVVREAGDLGVKVSLLPRFSEVLGSAVAFDKLPMGGMLAVRRFELRKSSRLQKRGFDLLAGGVILCLVAPFMLMIAAAIKATSRGPVFFRQTRVGCNGRTFQMLKFRSMVANAEMTKASVRHLNEAEGLFKIPNDPRVTRVGFWMRRTSLDELPQLINVLFGEMSLVGPRPLIVEEDQQIEGWRRRRLSLPPGMTGHWQLLGAARVSLEEMAVIDHLYVANWSLWQDVKCLLRTVPFVVGRQGW